MKKVYLKTLALLLSIGLSTYVHAQDIVQDGIYYDITGESEVTVTGSDGTVTNIVFPETVADGQGNEYSVVYIGDAAFEGHEEIISVVFPSTMKATGCDIFKECFNLERVTLNEGLESMQWWCFDGALIEEITIPSTMTSFEGETFGGLSNLKKVTSLIKECVIRPIPVHFPGADSRAR